MKSSVSFDNLRCNLANDGESSTESGRSIPPPTLALRLAVSSDFFASPEGRLVVLVMLVAAWVPAAFGLPTVSAWISSFSQA